jgi:hypothetical protein
MDIHGFPAITWPMVGVLLRESERHIERERERERERDGRREK